MHVHMGCTNIHLLSEIRTHSDKPILQGKTASRISKSLIHPIATCMAIGCTYPSYCSCIVNTIVPVVG